MYSKLQGLQLVGRSTRNHITYLSLNSKLILSLESFNFFDTAFFSASIQSPGEMLTSNCPPVVGQTYTVHKLSWLLQDRLPTGALVLLVVPETVGSIAAGRPG